jgi:hypothetical protein
VAFEAVKLDDTFVDTSDAANTNAAPEAERATTRDRYDLATAIGVVRAMETSDSRTKVFEEIKAKNAVYRLVDRLYTLAGAWLFQPLILFAYMVKCAISLGSSGDDHAEAVAISQFDNEDHTIKRVAALAPNVPLMWMQHKRKHMFAPRQIREALAMVAALGRVWPFLRIVARTHSFMPAARIASALAFYIRCSRLFAQHPELRAAIVASNYSPESVGMAAAAHRYARRVIYSNHAPVPANGPVVPPVYADCALFYGAEITRTYERRSAITAEVGYIGQPGTSRPMEWRDSVETVGIFLTAGTKVDALKSLVASIRLDLPTARIIIRQHPVTLLKTDFADIGVDDPYTELTIGNPLDDEIAACDLVICGNSGVSLNVLSGGRPVAYLSSLDGFAFDANGFVENRLTLSVPWWSDDIYARLKAFYQAPGWEAIMQDYDASYGRDLAELHAEAAEVLLRHLRPETEPFAAKKRLNLAA